jgi:hypothetical protein
MPKRISVLRQNKLPIIEINSCYPCEYYNDDSLLKNLSLENNFGIKLNNLNSIDLEFFFKDINKSDDCLMGLNTLIIDSELNSFTLEKLAQNLPKIAGLQKLNLLSLKTNIQFSKFIKFLSQQTFQKKINFIHNSEYKEIVNYNYSNSDNELKIICADNLDFQSIDFYKFIYKQLSLNPISIRGENANKNLGNLPLLHMNFSGINFNRNLSESPSAEDLPYFTGSQNIIAQRDKNFENNKSISSDLKNNILKVNPKNKDEFFAQKCAMKFAENIPQERFKLLNNFQIKYI